jgi:hypothetical protein
MWHVPDNHQRLARRRHFRSGLLGIVIGREPVHLSGATLGSEVFGQDLGRLASREPSRVEDLGDLDPCRGCVQGNEPYILSAALTE